MKILVTGAGGQLGKELLKRLTALPNAEILAADHNTLDITDQTAVEEYTARHNPTHVVNCGAYTNVDGAEDNQAICYDTNVKAVGNLASLAGKYGFKMIQISSDYVFDGNKSTAYSESDRPNPLSMYGKSKQQAEDLLIRLVPDGIIIRTGWLYSSFGHNFVKTILKKAAQGNNLKVVDDQIGTPTYAGDLADFIVYVIDKGKWTPGIYNYSNEGIASWYDLAVAACEYAGLNVDVKPIHSDAYHTAAKRPRFSVLDKSKAKSTFGIIIPHWQTSLRKCVEEIKLNN